VANVARSVYVRPEPWTAQYYRGRINFLDDLLLGLKDEVDVTLLPPRQGTGENTTPQRRFGGIRVIATALDIAEIAPDLRLVYRRRWND